MQTTVQIRSGPLVGAVLSRVVGMLAARAQCPIDRLDDALLVTDAVAAHAPARSKDGHVQVAVDAPGHGSGAARDAPAARRARRR